MRQDMTGFWDAVPSTGPYANNLHLAPDRSSLNFYRPDALSDAQSTVSKHWGKLENKQIQTCWPGICVSIAGNFLTLKCRFHFSLCQPRIDCDDGFFIIRRHICESNMTGLHTRHQSPRVHQLKLTPLLFSTPHTHTCLTALCPGLPGLAGTRKVKPIRILLKQEIVSDSGISWAICKSAPCSRQITMPVHPTTQFLQARCPSCRPTNSVKALKAYHSSKFHLISERNEKKDNSESMQLCTCSSGFCFHSSHPHDMYMASISPKSKFSLIVSQTNRRQYKIFNVGLETFFFAITNRKDGRHVAISSTDSVRTADMSATNQIISLNQLHSNKSQVLYNCFTFSWLWQCYQYTITGQFPDIFLTAVKVHDISRFYRQKVSMQVEGILQVKTCAFQKNVCNKTLSTKTSNDNRQRKNSFIQTCKKSSSLLLQCLIVKHDATMGLKSYDYSHILHDTVPLNSSILLTNLSVGCCSFLM